MNLNSFFIDYISMLILIWNLIPFPVKMIFIIFIILSILILIHNIINSNKKILLNKHLNDLLKVELELLELREQYENNDINHIDYLSKSRLTANKSQL